MSDAALRLTRFRAQTQQEIDTLRAEVADIIDSASSTTLDDEHDPEGMTIGFERAQAQAMLDAAQERLPDIDAALSRIADGTYGTCTFCGTAISAGRLDARPETDRCIACASRG